MTVLNGRTVREREEEHLAALRKALTGRVAGLELVTPETGPPYLRVTGAHEELTEGIRVARVGDGWWFWWSWGEPICPAGDVDTAADRVVRVVGGGA